MQMNHGITVWLIHSIDFKTKNQRKISIKIRYWIITTPTNRANL